MGAPGTVLGTLRALSPTSECAGTGGLRREGEEQEPARGGCYQTGGGGCTGEGEIFCGGGADPGLALEVSSPADPLKRENVGTVILFSSSGDVTLHINSLIFIAHGKERKGLQRTPDRRLSQPVLKGGGAPISDPAVTRLIRENTPARSILADYVVLETIVSAPFRRTHKTSLVYLPLLIATI